ncbi:MAG: DUF1326 domain-containing protein [Actinomycetota bacterium]|nr:DUF1326 domain-containing protein [Actinomycetota bacterium]
MAWMISGHYVSACSCTNVCPCPTASAPPDNPDGTTNCWGGGVWDIRKGSSGDVDLSGVRFAINVHFPEVVSNGNWQVGVVIDEKATDEQADIIGQILSGQLGGPFGEMAPLIGQFMGVERAPISYSDTSIGYGGNSYTYEPTRGQDGNPTMVSNAPFGFAPQFEIGACDGQLDVFGHQTAALYGEAADFVYGSEDHEHVRA